MTSQQQAAAALDRASPDVGVIEARAPQARVAEVPAEAAAGDPATVSPWSRSPMKRLLDLAVSLVALPFVCVLVAGAGVVSMFAFRSWPFFVQQRRGLGNRRIRTLKIRSLDLSFPPDQGKLGLDVSGQGRWSRMLRHSHVDELPQVFNVIAGSMSVVGPRPMIDPVLELLDPAEREERALVRPGLTGAWQVSTAGAHPLHECTELDAAYVRHCSLGTDLRILWWTARVTLTRHSMSPSAVLDAIVDEGRRQERATVQRPT